MPFNTQAHEALRLTDERSYYKPFRYPQFYELATEHQDMNWTRKHVKTLAEDIADFKSMAEVERLPLEALLSYFTLVDTDVARSYFKNLGKFYTHQEILMWIARVADREATHVDCYDMLPDQFGISTEQYSKILEIEAVQEQHMFMLSESIGSGLWERLSTLVKHISGEGIGIYGIFLPLVNYSAHGRMKAVGQEIVSWSARDENHHVVGLTELFRIEVEENQEDYTAEMQRTLRVMMKTCVENTDSVLDYIYSLGEIKHLTLDEVKVSVRQVANARSEAIGLGVLYPEVQEIPLLSMMKELFNGSELANFFETSNTSYGFYSGEWKYPTNPDAFLPVWEEAELLLNS